MLPLLLTLLAALSLAAHLAVAASGFAALVFVFKPLTTCLVIALAWTLGRESRAPVGHRYARWILGGLACSLAGDIALMLPGDWFVPGLVAFLLAHVCYIAAFSGRASDLRPGLEAVPFAVAYGLLVGRLAAHVGALLVPVAAYGAALIGMAWCAVQAWRTRRTRGTAVAAIGGLFFVASDTLLAFGRFVPGAPHSEAAVMSTYIAAQLLIAWSSHVSHLEPLNP